MMEGPKYWYSLKTPQVTLMSAKAIQMGDQAMGALCHVWATAEYVTEKNLARGHSSANAKLYSLDTEADNTCQSRFFPGGHWNPQQRVNHTR